MNDKLKILELYDNVEPSKIDSFNNNLQSNYIVKVNSEKSSLDFEWLDLMEETVRYIDNILRNPNRFIVNEEEIVKVEQARKITVETIKHLSKHTNYIQEIDKNGEVRPSKILNINKDESYDTYENRLIYTLIQNMRTFIEVRKSKLVTTAREKNSQESEYHGKTSIGNEIVDINVMMHSDSKKEIEYQSKNDLSVEERIAKLELRITDLTNTNVYKTLAKAHVARVIPPIKKTNLILKNVNFQYAMKLWDYLQSYVESGTSVQKDNVEYKDDVNIKGLFDDVFLLNYLICNTFKGDNDISPAKKEEAIERITNDMINTIVQINSELPIEDIQKIIGDKIAIIKNKKEASIKEIEDKINSKVQSALSKIANFSFN